MVVLTRNAVPQADFDKISETVLSLYDLNKKVNDYWNSTSASLPVVYPEWEAEIGRDALEKAMSRDTPKNKVYTKARKDHFSTLLNQKSAQRYSRINDILSRTYGEVILGTPSRFYNPTDYMGWHTNYESPGARIYVIWSTGNESSFFRYYDREKDEIITDYDDKGLTIREFNVTHSDPLWHCVGCIKEHRLSMGFRKRNETRYHNQ